MILSSGYMGMSYSKIYILLVREVGSLSSCYNRAGVEKENSVSHVHCTCD